MLHGHEDGVDDEAGDDPEVEERVHDEGVKSMFETAPAATTIPLQDVVGEDVTTWRTQPVV